MSCGIPGLHRRCWWRSVKTASTWKILPAVCRTIWSAGPSVVEGETIRHEGSLSATDMTAAEAETLIMAARLQLGWIEPEPEPEADTEAEVEGGADAAATTSNEE